VRGDVPLRNECLHPLISRYAVPVRRPSRSITSETLTKMVDPLHQHHKCSGCNPGKCPDTGKMVFVSWTGSRDIAHDTYLCIVDWRSEPPQR